MTILGGVGGWGRKQAQRPQKQNSQETKQDKALCFKKNTNRIILLKCCNTFQLVKINTQCKKKKKKKEIEKKNRMGKTRDLFGKIRDTKGTFHAKMGSIKDRNGRDLTEVEGI